MKKIILILLLGITVQGIAGVKLKPTPLKELDYQASLLPDTYQTDITAPQDILGFPVGQRVATPLQISKAVTLWDEQSDRLQTFQYATSHEGRPLYYVLISSPENLANADKVKQQLSKLADPEDLSDAEADKIIEQLPAVAWMAYSIHGNESSGADAALTAIYHLAASESDDVKNLLQQAIIIVDPMMNPDGRARFAKELQENRGIAPNVDDQSLLHTGSWPYGRTNHYYFDLNRDFIFSTQPETRGRIKMINEWYPQLMIDGHEMGAQDTYLFAPAREPVNPHLPKSRKKWGWIFAEDQSRAFDEKGWRYYTGEWFENLYSGYSNYAEYRGAVHILYEQARMAEDGVRRPEGTILTYKESVHHQVISTFANLKTLVKHSKDMYKDFVRERRQNIASSGPYADRTFVVLPTDNATRMDKLIDALSVQGIEFYRLTKSSKVSADDQFGATGKTVTLPVGTLVIPNRQPEARLLATMMEFDATIKPSVLVEERQRTLRDGSSLMYDTTAWNITMMYGLEAYTVQRNISNNLEPWKTKTVEKVKLADAPIALAVNGADDNSVGFAARLMEQGVQVRVTNKATVLSDNALSRGSVVVTETDNPDWQTLLPVITSTAETLGLELLPLASGMGEGQLPDWGGQHFPILQKPQVAMLARGGFSSYDVGATWFSLDDNLAIRHSLLNSLNFNYADLRRYNVLILPNQYGEALSESAYKAIDNWVKNGGTLIAMDGSARQVIKHDISRVTLLEDSFEDAEAFDIALQREWLAKNVELDMEQINAHQLGNDLAFPMSDEVKRLPEEKLKKLDKWQREFMPSGAFVAARVDQKHWLSFGSAAEMPLLFANNPLFMSDESTEAVTRIGVFEEASSNVVSKLAKSVMTDRKAIGWSTIPEDKNLVVRLSGLVWPEAAQRMANAAHLTRESVGQGQVILFATSANFRGATRATNRMLLNAIVYGPGLGTENKIEL